MATKKKQSRPAARKKAAAKKAPAKKAPAKKAPAKTPRKKAAKKKRPAALSEHGVPKLRRDQLAKWRYLDAEQRAAASAYQAAKLNRATTEGTLNQVIQKYDEVRIAAAHLEQAARDAEAAKRELQRRMKAHDEYMRGLLEARGLNPKGVYAIDDGTGVIRELPPNKGEASN